MNVTLALLVVLGAALVGVVVSARLTALRRRRPAPDLERLEHEALEPRSAKDWGHSRSCSICAQSAGGATLTDCRAVPTTRGFQIAHERKGIVNRAGGTVRTYRATYGKDLDVAVENAGDLEEFDPRYE